MDATNTEFEAEDKDFTVILKVEADDYKIYYPDQDSSQLKLDDKKGVRTENETLEIEELCRKESKDEKGHKRKLGNGDMIENIKVEEDESDEYIRNADKLEEEHLNKKLKSLIVKLDWEEYDNDISSNIDLNEEQQSDDDENYGITVEADDDESSSENDNNKDMYFEDGKSEDNQVPDCKEKWRYIQSSFLRSMKARPSGSKPKKPYYPKEHRQFILPHVKETNTTENNGNVPEPTNEETQEVASEVHNGDPDEQIKNDDPAEDETVVPALTTEERQSVPAEVSAHFETDHHRKRSVPESEQIFINYLKTKTRKVENEKTGTVQTKPNASSAMQYFLMSLLPDLENMTEHHKRIFKFKVMMVIDEIKSNSNQGPHPFDHILSNQQLLHLYHLTHPVNFHQ